jgi:hypothetical protein
MPPDGDLSTAEGLRELGLYLDRLWAFVDATRPCWERP